MDSKPFYLSLSFWGVIGSLLTPIAAKYGIVIDAGTFAAMALQVVAGAVGLYGVFRRPDIRLS